MASNLGHRTVLGLDLGVTSVGWALVDYIGDEPVGIRAIGVRHFETAATTAKEFEAGTHKTKNADRRRPQRHMRRQLNRRKQRKRQTFQALQAAGLLPAASAKNEDQRHKVIRQVDARLRRQWMVKGDHRQQQLLPYLLRDAASRREVTAEELGRALYHLAQRRGFKSNRKTDRDESEKSTIYEGIGALEQEMQTAGCETYGQYFATLDPQEIDRRIRGRYTSRQQYENEFDKIIETQLPFHPQLAQHAKAIRRVIFFQNPLKSQRQFLGKCELEENRRRAPKACLEFQRYRVCQQVNNLSLESPDGSIGPLEPEQREKLYDTLEHKEKLTRAGILKQLGFNSKRGYAVHGIGESGKEIIGNRTACKLRDALGNVWDGLSDDQQARLVDEIIQFTNPDALARRLAREFSLPQELARAAAYAHLDGDYASYSRVALKKLLPLLKAGHTLPSAIEATYGDALIRCAEVAAEENGDHLTNAAPSLLPPLTKTRYGRYVRNPVVIRCLSELRKVVNHIVRDPDLGRPDEIRIELLRDLKRSKKVREERHKAIKKNQDRNERIKEHLQTAPETSRFFTGGPPRRDDVDKWKLYEECDGECPYTGRQISPGDLYGPSPQFDIEHIIPRSRFPDNSLANKTLCELKENREKKKGQMPREAYHGTDQYDQILRRVKGFKGPLARRKLELFQLQDVPARMTAQQLVDSQYTAVLAADYLGELYGGRVDSTGQRVSTSNGRVTAHLRSLWRLNEILGREDVEKNRADLRHHAVDALVVALTGPAAVERLACYVQEGERLRLKNPFAARRQRREKPFDLPWEGFREEAERNVSNIVVSHRPEHRLRGKLHKDTMYRGPGRRGAPNPNLLTQRIELEKLDRKTIEGEALVSPFVKRCVLEKLRSLDQPGKRADPKKVFKDVANLPQYPGVNGRPPHVIRRVKIYLSMPKSIRVRDGNSKGHYQPGGNHHVPILVEIDAAGNEKHDQEGRPILRFGDVVSRFDAVRRLTENGGEVVKQDYGPGVRLKFTLMRGDLVEMADDDGVRHIYRMMKASDNNYVFRAIHLAEGDRNSLKGRKDLFQNIRSNRDFRKRSPRKVIVDPLGRVHNCGG